MALRDRQHFITLRLIKGKSPSEVAKETGMSASTIAKWRVDPRRGGTRYPRMNSIVKVLDACNADLEVVDRETGRVISR
jgi:transcriptional regulator with XRE-family HTH domain